MSDEEFVQAHWDDTRVMQLRWGGRSWHSLAEFTRERLEQIRQLERDIDFMRQFESSAEEWLEHLDRQRDADENAADARSACPMVRIIARLESDMADLKRGMTPTP